MRGLSGNNETLEYEEDPIPRWQAEATSHCEPLYLEDYFLMRGHDASTRNATATFVAYGGKYYACTCRHAVEIVHKRRESGSSKFETLALFMDKTRIPLSFFTAEGLQDSISIVTPGANEEYMDLALTDITEHSPTVGAHGKVAIEMDDDKLVGWVRREAP
jgi:hypothetical protein